MSDRERLRDTFESVAQRYHSARPDYPAALFDDLISLTGLSPGARLVEVGCGTGKATIPLARRGFDITALERGAALAEQARLNLHDLPNARVLRTSFEDWESETSVDLVYAATAWHWIDPKVAYARAAARLRPGGHLAVWAASHGYPSDADPFFTEIQAVYQQIGEWRPEHWPPPPPDQLPGLGEAFEASGLFDVVGVRRYLWAIRYTAEEYLALLDTFSGHIAMEPAKRDRLYGEIRRLLAQRPDGSLTRHWATVLTVGRLRGAVE